MKTIKRKQSWLKRAPPRLTSAAPGFVGAADGKTPSAHIPALVGWLRNWRERWREWRV